MDKKEKGKIKEQVEALGFEVAGVQAVWSNGKASRKYVGQDDMNGWNQRYQKEKGYRKMVAVYIEVDEIVSED
jgi:uncharacterized protein YukE